MTSTGSPSDTLNIITFAAIDLESGLESEEKLADEFQLHSANGLSAVVNNWSPPTLDELATWLDDRSAELDQVDVAILSVGLALPLGSRTNDVDTWFSAPLEAAVAILKHHDVFVIVLNGSTYDPNDSASDLNNDEPPLSLMVHRLDAALIRLSVLDGISIVDVDRLVAEMAGKDAVRGLLEYTPACAAVIRAELVHVLEDCRFFSAGPNVRQVGIRSDTDAA